MIVVTPKVSEKVEVEEEKKITKEYKYKTELMNKT